MRVKHWLLATVGAVAAFAIIPSAVVRADTIHVTNASTFGTPDGGGNFVYTFNLSFDSLGEIDSGPTGLGSLSYDQFAQITFFPGVVSATFAIDGPNSTGHFLDNLTATTTVTPGVGPIKVDFTTTSEINYNASATDMVTVNSSNDELIGVLTVHSSLPGTIFAPLGAWNSQDISPASEVFDTGGGAVLVPVAAPLPASASMGFGLFGLLAFVGIRRARRSVMA